MKLMSVDLFLITLCKTLNPTRLKLVWQDLENPIIQFGKRIVC